jgi:hypothetical protein
MTLHAAGPEFVIDPLNDIAPIAARAGSSPTGFLTPSLLGWLIGTIRVGYEWGRCGQP